MFQNGASRALGLSRARWRPSAYRVRALGTCACRAHHGRHSSFLPSTPRHGVDVKRRLSATCAAVSARRGAAAQLAQTPLRCPRGSLCSTLPAALSFLHHAWVRTTGIQPTPFLFGRNKTSLCYGTFQRVGCAAFTATARLWRFSTWFAPVPPSCWRLLDRLSSGLLWRWRRWTALLRKWRWRVATSWLYGCRLAVLPVALLALFRYRGFRRDSVSLYRVILEH